MAYQELAVNDGGDLNAFQTSPEAPLLISNDEATGNSGGTETEQSPHRETSALLSLGALLTSPLLDETGSGWGVVLGFVTLSIIGTTLGMVLPKNPDLRSDWYRCVSASIGYTYFLCWSVSFYPQVISNWKNRSTRGLSADFCGLNVIGFACYSVYNLAFYFSPLIRELYRERYNGAEVSVQSNDVAFAVHAFILSTITFIQIAYYGGTRALKPEPLIGLIMTGILLTIIGYMALVVLKVKSANWLNFLYLLSFVKVFVSLIKYIPQVIMNCKRRSTKGWSIWNILLDFVGGTLSDLQLVLDCWNVGDWGGITGNIAKFCLGSVSIVFDVIFMLQHYVLYPKLEEDVERSDSQIYNEVQQVADITDDENGELRENVQPVREIT